MLVKCCLLQRDTVPSYRNIFRFSKFVSMSWSGLCFMDVIYFYFRYV